jgi:ubiquinone/menaquinone biosynthesis C-methylase UbiE
MVSGFAQASPNTTLMSFAAGEWRHGARALDIGCGAARNALPLAGLGWNVLGLDLSWPMLRAAVERARGRTTGGRLDFVLAPMERLPVRDASVDLIVAHGIWNLAGSAAQFRAAVREAARAARPGAALFVFTFSRTTLAPDAAPVPGEPFVFTQFSGAPQCFLTREQLIDELGAAGFTPDAVVPLREHNAPRPGTLRAGGAPVIFEGTFRRGS